MGLTDAEKALVSTAAIASHEGVAVIYSYCTDHVAQKSQANWREVAVRERDAKVNTHHFWGAVCTFVLSSHCISDVHSSSGLYSYSHNFKIQNNRGKAMALSHLPFGLGMYCTLFTMERRIWNLTVVSSGKYILSFPMCTWSSSPQRFPAEANAVQLDNCFQNQPIKDERSVSSVKGGVLVWGVDLCLVKGGARSSGFVKGYRNRGSWTLIFLLTSANPMI